MRCTSLDGPSVAIESACVWPRVKSPEPWVRGRTPTSTLIGRIVVVSRPSIRMFSFRTSSRTVALVSDVHERRADAVAAPDVLEPVALLGAVVALASAADLVGDVVADRVEPLGQAGREVHEQLGGGLRVGHRAVRAAWSRPKTKRTRSASFQAPASG